MQHRLCHLVEVLERLGRVDDHLDRRTLCTRQGRQREHEHLATGDRAPLLLQHLLQLRGRALALAPWLEHHSAQSGPRLDDLEHHLVLGNGLAEVEYLLRVAEHLLGGGIWQRLQLVEEESLVLFRGELFLGGHAEQNGRTEQHQAHDDHHGIGLQQVVQQALIRVPHPLELPVDELHEASALLFAAEETRAHHRRERESDDGGDGDRTGEREGELGEQRAGESLLETDRHVHRHQHHGHRENRATELTGGEE